MYQVDLEVYQGPFDLLLDLIESEQIDIWDIPIARIAGQYLDHLRQMQEMDLAVGSEFLVMAATLLEIKAKMLLPAPLQEEDEGEEEEDPREGLVARLLEYKMYKEIANHLKHREQETSGHYTRGYIRECTDTGPIFTNPVGVDLRQLAGALEQALEAAEEVEAVEQIQRQVSIEERIGELRLQLSREHRVRLSQLFEGAQRWDIIVTFLAVLELIRMGEIKGRQRQAFSDISLEFLGDRNSEVVS